MNAYEKVYPEKNKNACQNAVAEIWKNLKKDDELRKEVDRKVNEWKELSITKKSKMTDFWSGVW